MSKVPAFAKAIQRQLVPEIVSYPGNYGCVDILDFVCGKKHAVGARPQFPLDFLFTLGHCARVTGADNAVAQLLAHDDDCYRATRNGYMAVTGKWVPRDPPSVDQIVAPAEALAQDEHALSALLRRRIDIEVEHARWHGNLLAGVVPDWAHPDLRHQILGDGVIFDRYSNVILVRDPFDRERWITVGSSAKDPRHVRMQTSSRRPGADDKNEQGINFIMLSTETVNGVVVLAIDRAFGAEAPVLMPLIEAVVAAAGDGVHSLAYDGVVPPGRLQDELMARMRVGVINKPVAAAVKKGTISARESIEADVRARAAVPGARPLTPKQLEIAVMARAADLLSEGHLPAGVSIYPTTNGFDILDSQVKRFTEDHPNTDHAHRDRFIVDDETLFLVCPEELGKGAYCAPLSSVPEPTEYGTWARRTRWSVPCPAGQWPLEKLWTPGLPPHVLDTAARSHQKVIAHMDPVPRQADTFEAGNRRSVTESINNIFKSSVHHYGRAAHLHVNRQMIDCLGFAQVLTAATYHRHPDAPKPWRVRL